MLAILGSTSKIKIGIKLETVITNRHQVTLQKSYMGWLLLKFDEQKEQLQVFQLKNNVLKNNSILNVQIEYPKFYQLHQGILQLVLLHGAKP